VVGTALPRRRAWTASDATRGPSLFRFGLGAAPRWQQIFWSCKSCLSDHEQILFGYLRRWTLIRDDEGVERPISRLRAKRLSETARKWAGNRPHRPMALKVRDDHSSVLQLVFPTSKGNVMNSTFPSGGGVAVSTRGRPGPKG